jgi:hypothetical protein
MKIEKSTQISLATLVETAKIERKRPHQHQKDYDEDISYRRRKVAP